MTQQKRCVAWASTSSQYPIIGQTGQMGDREPGLGRAPRYARLISRIMARRMIAPTTAAMIEPTSPPAPIPNMPNNQRADDADHDIADKAKAAPLHDHASKPPGDGADQ